MGVDFRWWCQPLVILSLWRAVALLSSLSDKAQPERSRRVVYCLLYKKGITNWNILNVRIENFKLLQVSNCLYF